MFFSGTLQAMQKNMVLRALRRVTAVGESKRGQLLAWLGRGGLEAVEAAIEMGWLQSRRVAYPGRGRDLQYVSITKTGTDMLGMEDGTALAKDVRPADEQVA